MKQKTIIVSPDANLRQALEFLLNTEPSAQIAGSINNYSGLLALVQVTSPDLVLFDWDVPNQNGAELIQALNHINPAIKTIVFSNAEMEQHALSAGADICIAKGSPPETILESFRAL